MSGTVSAEPTFLEHVHEFRKRLIITVLSIGVGAGLGWKLFEPLVHFLSQPLKHSLYYSAPTGELSFMIKVCLVFGVVMASPIVFFHIVRFIQPALKNLTLRRIILYCNLSVGLAACGIAFAYFVSLPMTLTFLLNIQGEGGLIQPLISADEYFNFVLAYIAGFAILFQIPLVVLIINKITPLTPSSLFKSFRFVVLFSFIAAAIITPTPDPVNQAIMAVPVIVLYFVSAMILLAGQSVKRKKVKPSAIPSVPTAATAKPAVASLAKTAMLPEARPKAAAARLMSADIAAAPSAQRLSKTMRPNPRFMQDIQRARPQKTPQRPVYSQPLRNSGVISDFL